MKLDTYSTPPLQLRNEPLAKNSIEAFNGYFEMVPALSDELKNEVYKLRYQVYCIENSFLNSDHYPDNLEFDEFDTQSIHYLIRHRKSGEYAATVRLILPDAHNPKKLFPIELHCKIDNFAVMQLIDRQHLGEVSRLCVSKAFKKRKYDDSTLEPINSVLKNCSVLIEKRCFPHMTLILIASIIKASHENNIDFLYATTEASLSRFVSAYGIDLIKIGPLADYNGPRLPAVIKITDMLDRVAEKNQDIWSLLTNKGAFFTSRTSNTSQNVITNLS